MKWLLALYPPMWRKRYRLEVEAHLEHEPRKLRTALDLVAGAIDAWLNPKWIPQSSEQGGETMITASRCASADVSKADAAISAGWMIGLTLALTTLGVTLDKTIGPHVAIEALLHSSFFIALAVSSQHTFLKPYSRVARNVIIAAMTVGWYGFFLGVSALAALT